MKTDKRQLNPGPGVPPKWPDLIEPAWKYVNEDYANDGSVIPTAAGLAVYLGVSRRMINQWATDVDEFALIHEALMAKQEKLLVANGLMGEYNSTLAKLILSKHGYSDKQETEITGSGINLVINK